MGHKTLHESAAEILAASVASAGREPLPMAAMMTPAADLGGEMLTGDVVSPGLMSAQSINATPKPGRPGAPAEEIKKLPTEDEESEENSESEKSENLMENLIAAHGYDRVCAQLNEILIEQYGEDGAKELIIEAIINDFKQREFTEDEFMQLEEDADQLADFIESQSDEEVVKFFEGLNEEEIVYTIQLASLDEETDPAELAARDYGNSSIGGESDGNVNASAPAPTAAPNTGRPPKPTEPPPKGKKWKFKRGQWVLKKKRSIGKILKKIAKVALPIAAGFLLPGIGSAIAGKLGFGAAAAGGAAGGAAGAGAAASGVAKAGLKAGLKTLAKNAVQQSISGTIQGGVQSKLSGGSFSAGLKSGAKSGAIGGVTGGIGGGIAKATGSELVGNLARDVAGAKLQGGKTRDAIVGSLANAAGAQVAQGTGSDLAGDAVSTGIVAANQKRDRGSNLTAQTQDNEPLDIGNTINTNKWDQTFQDAKKNIRSRSGTYRMAAENIELINQLSSLNEEQLDQFINSLSEDQVEYVVNLFERGGPRRLNKRNIRGAQDRIIRGRALDAAAEAEEKRAQAERERIDKEGLKAGDGTQIIPPKASATNTAAPKYGERGTGANKGKFWTGTKFQSPSEMSDEDRYGKTGAAIRRYGGATAMAAAAAAQKAAGQEPDPAAINAAGKLGTETAYNLRDKTKEGNLKLAQDLKDLLAKTEAGPSGPSVTGPQGPWRVRDRAGPSVTGPQGPSGPSVTPQGPGGGSDGGSASNPGGNAPGGDLTSYVNWNNRGSGSDASSNASETGGGEITDQGRKKDLGDVGYDWLKRAGRAGIRAGIGGALTGQDWERSARAGAVGQASYDLVKGIWDVVRPRPTAMNERIEDSNMNASQEHDYDVGEDQSMETTETIEDETTELTEEQIREQRMLAIKETVKQFRGNMREDVDALFNGESLSEEFRAKATLIFESAVSSRVEAILEQVIQQNDEVLANAYEEIKSNLTEQVDEYLNYVVEQWMEQNQVAIETGLRAELAEDFISGLRSLFQEHYIEIPEERVDVAETLAAELENAAEYVEGVHEYVAGQQKTISSLQEQLNAVQKEKAVNSFCEGLTAVQAGKMKALAEGVEFTAEGDFEEKLAVLRENYFPTKVQVKSEVKELQRVSLDEEPEVEKGNSVMARYVQSISKTAPKA